MIVTLKSDTLNNPTIMTGITTYAASVVNITELKTEATAIQPSTNVVNNKELHVKPKRPSL